MKTATTDVDPYLDVERQLELGADELVQYGERCTGLAAEVPDRRYGLRYLGSGTSLLQAAIVIPEDHKGKWNGYC